MVRVPSVEIGGLKETVDVSVRNEVKVVSGGMAASEKIGMFGEVGDS